MKKGDIEQALYAAFSARKAVLTDDIAKNGDTSVVSGLVDELVAMERAAEKVFEMIKEWDFES